MPFVTLDLATPIPLAHAPVWVNALPCRIAAGFPSPAEDHAVKRVDLMEQLIKHPQATFLLRVRGESMKDAGIRTAGEIGALLLEASLIKQQQPLLNQKLRRSRQLCSLRVHNGLPEVVYSKDINFATEPSLYGLFGSRHSAVEGLRNLADQNQLCYGALGLEKLKPGRACFRAMINKCSGVCRGDESLDAHRSRLFTSLEGLRVACWPYPGAIGLIERYQDESQIHVIRNWCYLGSVRDHARAIELDVVATGFDADGYKILCKPILSGSAEIILL